MGQYLKCVLPAGLKCVSRELESANPGVILVFVYFVLFCFLSGDLTRKKLKKGSGKEEGPSAR